MGYEFKECGKIRAS